MTRRSPPLLWRRNLLLSNDVLIGQRWAHAVKTTAVLSSFVLAPGLRAEPQNFVIDTTHSSATFEVSHLGISTQRGRFGNATGTATIDDTQGTGTLDITLDARSLNTGNEFLENLLKGDSWFNTEQFPVIMFSASKFTFVHQKPARIDGQLTLHGVTRPVTLNVMHYACTRKPFLVRLTCGMDATTVIKRSEFGMDNYAAFVGDDVKLLIQAEAVRQEPEPPKPDQ